MRRCIGMLMQFAALCAAAAGADELAEGFANPPDSARLHTFWHWMNGNITKEGITADLEAMRDAGIGGVFLFDIEGQVTESVPVYVEKPVRHLTPEWFGMVRHAATECKRLGLELSLMNCIGWTTSGVTVVGPLHEHLDLLWWVCAWWWANDIGAPREEPPLPFRIAEGYDWFVFGCRTLGDIFRCGSILGHERVWCWRT